MPWQRVKPPHRALFLALTLLFLSIFAGLMVRTVKATGNLAFVQSIGNADCPFSTLCSLQFANVNNGDLFILAMAAQGTCSGTPTVTSTFSITPTQIQTLIQNDGNGNIAVYVYYVIGNAGGTQALSWTCTGFASSGELSEFTGTFNGFGANNIQGATTTSMTGSNNLLLNVGSGSIIYETFSFGRTSTGPAPACAGLSANSGQNIRKNLCDQDNSFRAISTVYSDVGPVAGTGTLSLFDSWTGASSCSSSCSIVHSGLELTGNPASTTNVNTATVCYGNCGNPAVTLTNSNATHTVPFNTTVTLLYIFKAQANGFLVNVTANVAKTYLNGQVVSIGTYLDPCPIGMQPFSGQCPGLLQGQQSFTSPSKGMITESNVQAAVFAGEWIGIAVTAQVTGLDLNQTNIACGTAPNICASPPNMIQVSGYMPASINTYSSSTLPNISNTGLWAWLFTNLITGQPPPGLPNGGICAGLDCILTNVVNGSCSVVSVACQNGASIFWVIILTLITMGVLAYGLSEVFPSVVLGRGMLGEFTVLIFIGWLAAFGSFSLLSPWLLILMFFSITWLFIGKVKGTGPI